MADRETVSTYGAKAAHYETLVLSDAEDRALGRFIDALPPGAAVLDLGCGPGLQAARMAAAGLRVSGLDATPEFVAAARGRGIDARLGTFEDLAETAAYDGVLASFSLLHAPRADLPRHLGAIRRALKDGGRLFLGMKTGTGEHRDSLGRFYAYHTADELRRHLADAGFAIDHEETGAAKGLAGTSDPFILIHAHA